MTFTKSQGEDHDVHFSDQASGLQAPTTDAWTAMRTFATAGDYSFVCDIHAFMTGTVHVIAAPVSGPAPVAPGAPPGGVAPTAGSTPAADTVAPRATRLAGSLTVRRAVVRFRLGEAATVVVRIARRGSTRTVARVTRRLAAGDARLTLRHRLRAGSRYTVSLRITDAAGNVSRRTVTFTARR